MSPSGGDWLLHWEDGELVSRHGLKSGALIAALAVARSLPRGACSAIAVQGQDGAFRTEWSYSYDTSWPRA